MDSSLADAWLDLQAAAIFHVVFLNSAVRGAGAVFSKNAFACSSSVYLHFRSSDISDTSLARQASVNLTSSPSCLIVRGEDACLIFSPAFYGNPQRH